MSFCGIGLEIYSLTPRLQQRGQQWFCPHQLASFWDDPATNTVDSAVQDTHPAFLQTSFFPMLTMHF